MSFLIRRPRAHSAASVPRAHSAAVVSRALTAALLMSSALAGCAIAPSELSNDELTLIATENLEQVAADQEPVSGRIDLYEAMARALKYNLDYRVEAWQTAVRMKELRLAHFKMLPDVVAGSDYYERDNFSGGVSRSLLDGQTSLEASTSQERRYHARDANFSWHILDFGLSYIRAHQSADQVLIADEARRKVAARIIEDVRTAFWRAVSADRLIHRFQTLRKRVKRVLANTRQLSGDQKTSPLTALTYERELVEIKKRLEELERELIVAKSQLAALMNVKPNTPFTLVAGRRGRPNPDFNQDASGMVFAALQNRSELREVAYRRRINAAEADAALLELLPGIQLVGAINYNSNDFLFNNNWVNWGAKASWNVIKVFQYPATRDAIETNDGLLHSRSLALTMAIITQVHVSRIRFELYKREYATAREYLRVQQDLVSEIRSEAAAGRVSEQTLVREEMNTLVAEVKRDIEYANVQNAFANMYASMGYTTHPASYAADVGVSELAGALRSVWFERGDVNASERLAAK